MKKVNELQPGSYYNCLLSGQKVLCERIPLKEVSTMSGTQVIEWQIGFMYYNPMTGGYNHATPIDNQLADLP